MLLGQRLQSAQTGDLYYHWPCYDGVASAAITSDFLEQQGYWKATRFIPVNYGSHKSGWNKRSLGNNSAVVDFLFNRHARFWADHHASSFMSKGDQVLHQVKHRCGLAIGQHFDHSAPSCAGLLYKEIYERYGYRNPLFEELAKSADRIDSAVYDDPRETIFGGSAAINLSLAILLDEDAEFAERLIRLLRVKTLDEVMLVPEMNSRFQMVSQRLQSGLEEMRKTSALDDDGIVLTEVREKNGTILPRYGASVLYPEADYAIGLLIKESRIVVRAQENPWSDGNKPLNLGKIINSLDAMSGGHKGVGSNKFRADQLDMAKIFYDRLVAEIRRQLRESKSS